VNYTQPVKLQSAKAWRTYRGGKLLGELHGIPDAEDSHFPEEWLMSTVAARNFGREDIDEGLSLLDDGTRLMDYIRQNPSEILGENHYTRFKDQMGILVKLLDSAERLTIQVHPTKEKAKELFHSEFGKVECWHILGTRVINGEKPCVYIGFKEHVTRSEWEHYFREQNIGKMLGCLHKFEVKEGDTFLVSGGVPHAIGAGCFLVEIQESTDYTIRTEKTTPNGLEINDFSCHQGLGFSKMFDCFSYEGMSYENTLKRWKISPKTIHDNGNDIITLVDYELTDTFKLEMISVERHFTVKHEDVFRGLYVLNGQGTILNWRVVTGDQFFISAQCTEFEVVNTGNTPLKLMRFYGPNVNDC